MGMPGAMLTLRKHSPRKFKEACRRGGKAAARKRAKQKALEDAMSAAITYRKAQEEAELRRSTNEHILSADGEPVD